LANGERKQNKIAGLVPAYVHLGNPTSKRAKADAVDFFSGEVAEIMTSRVIGHQVLDGLTKRGKLFAAMATSDLLLLVVDIIRIHGTWLEEF
jgi:hypothetical protein